MSTELSRREKWFPSSIEQTLEQMRREMDRLFNLGSPLATRTMPSSRVLWSPPVDITETTDELILTAELPGIDQKDVSITLENNVLSVRGERRFDEEKKDTNYHLVERSYGVFQRSFTLPANVYSDKVSATMKHGLLQIHLPKKEESKPRTIDVKVES